MRNPERKVQDRILADFSNMTAQLESQRDSISREIQDGQDIIKEQQELSARIQQQYERYDKIDVSGRYKEAEHSAQFEAMGPHGGSQKPDEGNEDVLALARPQFPTQQRKTTEEAPELAHERYETSRDQETTTKKPTIWINPRSVKAKGEFAAPATSEKSSQKTSREHGREYSADKDPR